MRETIGVEVNVGVREDEVDLELNPLKKRIEMHFEFFEAYVPFSCLLVYYSSP